MLRVLILSDKVTWPFVAYDVDNPRRGYASDTLEDLSTAHPIRAPVPWPDWAKNQENYQLLATIDTPSLNELRKTHPELYV